MTVGAASVTVEGVSKRYRLGTASERSDSLATAAAYRLAAPIRNFRNLRRLHRFDGVDGDDVLWALKDVSFELQPGEVLGLIGGNGAGKSTLLKILSRVTDPTSGRATLRGRVASLLEIGTGFHGDLTGRDNVFLNGSMLGMRRREIAARFDEIVEFSGIEAFIDTPVKRYSSGMFVRLAFAVAAHVDPDVLIADEVLSVGDAEFQRRSLAKMREAAGSGRTVIFVSHNQATIASLCSRAIWLEKGRIKLDGDVQAVSNSYLAAVTEHAVADLSSRTDRIGSGAVRFVRAELRDADGRPSGRLVAGAKATLAVDYVAERELPGALIEFGLEFASGGRISTLSTRSTLEDGIALGRQGTISCEVHGLPLNSGEYAWTLFASVDGTVYDWISDVAPFTVDAGGFYPTAHHPPLRGGPILLDATWRTG